MSWIRDVPEESAGPELRAAYAAMTDPQSGRVDNILTVHGQHPEGLDAHFRLYQAVMAGTASLRKADRELIALVVSQVNGCHY